MDAVNVFLELGLGMKLLVVVATLIAANTIRALIFKNPNAPPHVPSPVPWFGNIVAFGEKPVDFLLKSFKEYGSVFSFTMFGQEVTYLLGSDASNQFWNASNDDLNAEDLYANITVPIFGKGVAFDVDNKVFSEQKQMAKDGLTKKRFATYTAKIEEECEKYMSKRWVGQQGEDNLHEAMAEMIVFTATRCLHGDETREAFTADVAALYNDLDGGFSPLAWFFPSWIPFPSFLKRDKAHVEIKKRFHSVIEKRKVSDDADRSDLLQTFVTSKYTKVNNQRALNNDEISGLLIALLMAGQHTSSTTSSWFGFFVSDAGLYEKLYQEQVKALGMSKDPIKLEDLDNMPLLHACVRETLRLRPPIMQMMRKVRKTFDVNAEGKTYTIPAGNQVCVSPSVNGRNFKEWDEPDKFDPYRFLKTEDGVTTVTKSEHLDPPDKQNKFKWCPFGAGRHRCIGYEFAQIQIRCVWSYMLRNFEIENVNGVPKVNYQTMIHTPIAPFVKWKRRA
eukprot:m.240155 g.240155  ORF g.240155 m.240155 type:complete len:504 (-) comp33760_c4_seq1:310-1821(-)